MPADIVHRSGVRTRGLAGRVRSALTGLTVLALVAVMVPLGALPAAAAADPVTYWVDVATGSDTNPGTSALPFKTITKASDIAGYADTIMVRPGTYNTASGEVFDFWLEGASLKSTGGPAVTIIEGDGAKRIMGMQYAQAGDVISGFTFRHGQGGSGGALTLYLNSSTGPNSPCVENNIFESNSSDGSPGGAIYAFTTGTPGCYPLIRNNVFEGNHGGAGGAIAIDSAIAPTIVDNVFRENTASSGGAISITTVGTASVVSGNVFSGNEATGGTPSGGALYYSVSGGETHRITGNEFNGNWAGGPGGALWLYGTTATVSGNRAFNNAATTEGGFARLQYSAVTATNNVIYGGSAVGLAAAWYLQDAYLREVNDTVVDNAPGNVATYAGTDDSLFISNCIYWNPDLATTEIMGADVISNCCVSDPDITNIPYGNSNVQSTVFSNPRFVNTGMPPIDVRIKPDSPCIDAGTDCEAVPDDDFFGSPRPVDGNRDSLKRYDIGFYEYSGPVRVAGLNRYATSVAASKKGFPDGANAIVIATGVNWPDALGGSALAGAVGGPLLLTRTDALPSEVVSEIKRLDAHYAYILGSTASVGPAVEAALKSMLGTMNVERLGGANRYETARKVADKTISLLGPDYKGEAFVATGLNFPDATGAAPLAAALGRPILLANLNAGTVYVPSATKKLTILGTTAAVPASIETYLNGALGAANVDRVGGVNRYATAALVAQLGVDAGMKWHNVGLATGLNFPDALSGGAMLGELGSVMLLTRPDVLAGEAKTKLLTNKAEIGLIYIFGDKNAVSVAVETSAKTAAGL